MREGFFSFFFPFFREVRGVRLPQKPVILRSVNSNIANTCACCCTGSFSHSLALFFLFFPAHETNNSRISLGEFVSREAFLDWFTRCFAGLMRALGTRRNFGTLLARRSRTKKNAVHARRINMVPCSATLGAYRYSAHVGRSSQPTGTNYLRYESSKNLSVDKQRGGTATAIATLHSSPLDGCKHLICIETRLTLAIKRPPPEGSRQVSITRMANLENVPFIFSRLSIKRPSDPAEMIDSSFRSVARQSSLFFIVIIHLMEIKYIQRETVAFQAPLLRKESRKGGGGGIYYGG